MAIDSVLHTNQYSIDRVLRAGLPVLLVFWRNDVPASREFDAVLDRLASEYAGRALVAKVDAAADQPLLARFDVRLLPDVHRGPQWDDGGDVGGPRAGPSVGRLAALCGGRRGHARHR